MQHQIEWIYVFLGIAIIVAGLWFAVWLWRRISAGPSAATRNLIAEHIAGLRAHRWYVKGRVQLQGGVGIWVSMEGQSTHKTFVPFRSGHPSLPLIWELVNMDIVEFEVEQEPLECALQDELCAYLKVKKVGHFA